MKIHRIVYRFFCNSFLFLVYALSGFFPRSKNIFVYGCPHDGFSDNAKYAYLYDVLEKSDGSSRYWVTSNKKLIDAMRKRAGKFNVVNRGSIRGIWVALRAGTYVYSSYPSDINFWLSRKAKLINYWHGIPIKKIEFDIESGNLEKRYNPKGITGRLVSFMYYVYHPAVFKRPDYLCSPIAQFDAVFMRAFRVGNKAIFREIYPRWRYIIEGADGLLTNDCLELTVEDEGEWKGVYDCLFLYLPTFRDSNKDWVWKHFIEHLSVIDDSLASRNFFLVIKLHPNEIFHVDRNYKNIMFLESQADAYPILKKVDVVITDYSSVMIDSAICDKNIVLYWPDISDYRESSRDSYFDLEFIFGRKPILSMAELKNFFKDGVLSERFVNHEIKDKITGADLYHG